MSIENIDIELKKYGKVYLPNIGLLSVHRESASPNWDELSLNPPSENVVFTSDVELINSSIQNIKIPEACKIQSESIMAVLMNQKEVELPALGRLYMDDETQFQFAPYECNSINAYYNELKSVSFDLVDHDLPSGSILETARQKTAKGNSRWLLLLLIFPLLLIYFFSTRHSDVPLEKIPNGKVNIKPEMPADNGTILFSEPDSNINSESENVQPELPKDNSLGDKNWNTKKSEIDATSNIEVIDPCYVIVGSFLNHQNSELLKLKLEADGYTVQLFPYQSYMRVGIHIDCVDSDSRLSEFKQNIHKDAWIIK